jgi:hypothetical protein
VQERSEGSLGSCLSGPKPGWGFAKGHGDKWQVFDSTREYREDGLWRQKRGRTKAEVRSGEVWSEVR